MRYGPSIVKNGLVLCLDAADRNSYSGTGTVWKDISANNNSATLAAGPGYSFSNGGYFTFNGSTQYTQMSIPQILSLSTITIECTINWVSNNGGMFLGFGGGINYDVWTNGGNLGYNNGASNVVGISSATVTSLGLIGNFKHYTFVMNSSGNLSTNLIYINGIQQTVAVRVGADGANVAFNSVLYLATWQSASSFFGNIACANFRVYNRALSQNEITQNYNALKGRFKLL
jgi:hypothetical protein